MGVCASGSLLKIGWIIALRCDGCGSGQAGIICKIINLKSITGKLQNWYPPRWSMAAAHILQVAYYDTLRELRVKMLEAAGYQVTSVSGNDNAMGLDGAVIAGANLIVVGFSAPHSVRAAMVLWFKTHYPKIPVVVLQFSSWEKFPEADVSTFSEDPTIWLTEVASILKS